MDTGRSEKKKRDLRTYSLKDLKKLEKEAKRYMNMVRDKKE